MNLGDLLFVIFIKNLVKIEAPKLL